MSEFKKLKQKVNNDKLKRNLVNHLEKSLFEEDTESIEPKEKYEEGIAERVKTKPRKQNASSSLPKKEYFEESADHLKYMEEQEKGQKKFSDDYDSNGWSSGSGNVVSKAKGTGLKILTNKQMLNLLPILLAQIQAGNNSIKLKNETRQILYSLYRSKVLTKTVYNNLIKSIRSSLQALVSTTLIKMETFFMNTKNSKTNEPNRFKYDLIDKLDFKNPNKNMALANLSIYYTWKNVRSTYNNKKFKISAPT